MVRIGYKKRPYLMEAYFFRILTLMMVVSNQIFAQKPDIWGQKLPFYYNWMCQYRGKKNAKLNCCHYLNQFYHSVSYIYKERRISNQSSQDSSTTVCRIPTFRFFTVDEISVKIKKLIPPLIYGKLSWFSFIWEGNYVLY